MAELLGFLLFEIRFPPPYIKKSPFPNVIDTEISKSIEITAAIYKMCAFC